MLKKKDNGPEISINEYINVADVKGNFLYTKDNYIFQYIRVQPLSTTLMTKEEKKMLTSKMTAELSPLNTPFKIILFSRPTDISQTIDYLDGIKSVTQNQRKKDSLGKSMHFLSAMATSGGVIERLTYIALWFNRSEHSEEELSMKTIEFKNALVNSSVKCHICDEREINDLLSLFYNPINAQSMRIDPSYTFTLLKEV
ncbi:hypothetical protein RBG61_06450 [Paludicola sp. MB14-C6]|uniref:hypothetical protein n=1 Tax=Paludihabitans sp. MB14-C6 TaxID=3070656 RepID=UPI0027DE518D|nr:hypothetical protein [Paludicola sp. MB14-C6]WMJ24301.1 hypothetical protein RBG61_06450 [Paludicola sp. MB14-C6]